MSTREVTFKNLSEKEKDALKESCENEKILKLQLLKKKKAEAAKALGLNLDEADITVDTEKYGKKQIKKKIKADNYAFHGYSVMRDDPIREMRLTGIHIVAPLGHMRPVDPEVRKILYTSDYATEHYLKERYKLVPEDKYHDTYCSSWQYGWRVKDRDLEIRSLDYRPAHAKSPHETLMNRTGLSPDPQHYIMPRQETIRGGPSILM